MKRMPALIALCMASSLVFLACLLQAAEINPGDVLLSVLEKDYKPDAPLLPPGVKVVQEYRQLSTDAIGAVDFVENQAYILHEDDPNTAYKAVKSNPIYQNDTLVAEAASRVVALLKDQSQFTLAASSKITLEKSVYDPAVGARDTVVNLAAGKARFVVQKVGKAQENDFKVQTPLAVIGVRGSDFVVAMVPEAELSKTQRPTSFLNMLSPVSVAYAQPRSITAGSGGGSSVLVFTGANTSVNFQGPIGPPVVMQSFQTSTVSINRPPSTPLNVTPSLAPGVMNRVGPAPSVMSMPSVFE